MSTKLGLFSMMDATATSKDCGQMSTAMAASAGANCIKIGLPGKSILKRLFPREYDFQKTLSLTENQFSGKTYFYTIHPRRLIRGLLPDIVEPPRRPGDWRAKSGHQRDLSEDALGGKRRIEICTEWGGLSFARF